MGKDKYTLNEKDQQAIDKLALPQYSDFPQFRGFVDVATQPVGKATKKLSWSKRILILTRHRLYVVDRGFFSYSTELNQHYYDIKTLKTERDELCISFSDKYLWVKTFSGTITGIIRIIRESSAKITIGWGDNAMQVEIPATQLDSFDTPDPSLALSETYIAQCNYFKSKVAQEFIHFCDYLKKTGRSYFDFNDCPGTQDGICDNSSILISLQYNTFFKNLTGESIPLSRGGRSLCALISSNVTLTSVSLTNMQGKIDWSLFGTALAANPNNAIQSINLSQNKMEVRDIEAFVKGLKEMKHALPYLNLSSCDLNSKAVATFFDGLRANFSVSLSIEELDISHNKFEEQGSLACAEWLNAASSYSKLKVFNVAATGLNIPLVIQHIRHLPHLEVLDLSENRIEKNSVPELVSSFNLSEKISTLILRNNKLAPEVGEQLVQAFMREVERKNLPGLDISHNDLPVERVMKHVCLSINNLYALNLEGNKFKGQGLCNFLSNCAGKLSALHELIIGANDLSPVDGPSVCKSLISFCDSTPTLTRLSLAKAGLSDGLKVFFEHLKTNSVIQWLDVSGNKLRNTFLDLVEALRTNNALRGIGIDDNKISFGGFQSLKYALLENATLQYLFEYPSKDVTALKSSIKSKLLTSTLNETLFDIEYKLKQNRNGKSVPEHEIYTFFDRYRDPHFVVDKVEPVSVLPEHLLNYVFTPSAASKRTLNKQDTVSAFNATSSTEGQKPRGTSVSFAAPTETSAPPSSEGVEMIAKFDYEATDSSEISITTGQTLIVFEKGNDGWSKGKNKQTGQTGFFPTDYVEPAPTPAPMAMPTPPARPELVKKGTSSQLPPPNEEDLPEAPLPPPTPERPSIGNSKKFVKAIADYSGQSESELTFVAGDVIEFLEDADQGWQKGSLNGVVGYFPSSYCEPM